MGMSADGLAHQLRSVFAHEAVDSLARIDALLARAPQPAAGTRDIVEALFREFHTMKVGAAAAGFGPAARALHDAESLLDAVRGGDIEGSTELEGLRRAVERVRGAVAGADPQGSAAATLCTLTPLLARTTATAAAAEGKLVALDIAGGDVALDAAAGVLHGALLHLVRNAVAHGIETPAERDAAGKPRVGRILVSAERRGDELRIAVSDDGRGLDRQAIAAHAARAGLQGPAEELVLRSGFSTRAGDDELAGRGVGLDAVAHAIRAQQGSIAIVSRDGQGCTITLMLSATAPPAAAAPTAQPPSASSPAAPIATAPPPTGKRRRRRR